MKRRFIYIVFIIGLCIILAFGAYYFHGRIRIIQRNTLLQRHFAWAAGRIRKGLESSELSKVDTETIKRHKTAVELLSNGVFDTQVCIIKAVILPPAKSKYGHPIVKESPRFILYVVDELCQVASVYYDDSNDPNAFGEPLFRTGHYYLLFPYYERPNLLWYLPMVCYGEKEAKKVAGRRLMKHDDGLYEPFVTLEVTVGEWNSLLAGRGQIILRDANLCELSRIRLKPSEYENDRETLKGLMLPED
jgi:hypothetical protein